jgi:hypothetical protein
VNRAAHHTWPPEKLDAITAAALAEPVDDTPFFTCNRAHYRALLARISDGDALIAELVGACAPALHELDVVIRLLICDRTRADLQVVADNLRAALAKAEGRA